MKRTLCAALACLALSACESSVKRQRVTTCRRIVPALLAGEAAPKILRVGSGAALDEIRVDYAVLGRSGQPARQRWVICGFGPGAELLAVTTERGPMNGAALYLLKRYYLDTPDAAEADPALVPAR